jgi:hypothetical protein
LHERFVDQIDADLNPWAIGQLLFAVAVRIAFAIGLLLWPESPI